MYIYVSMGKANATADGRVRSRSTAWRCGCLGPSAGAASGAVEVPPGREGVTMLLRSRLDWLGEVSCRGVCVKCPLARMVFGMEVKHKKEIV